MTAPAVPTPPPPVHSPLYYAGRGVLVGLLLLAVLYGIQLWVIAQRYAAPAETQDLGHGITLEIWEQRDLLDSVPLLGLLMTSPGAECILIMKHNGAECQREYFYPRTDAPPRALPGKLFQHEGKVVLQIQLDYARAFWLDLPAPAELPPLTPAPATTPQAP